MWSVNRDGVNSEEASKQPTPKPDTTWEEMWKTMAPAVSEAQQMVLSELDDVRKQERLAPALQNIAFVWYIT